MARVESRAAVLWSCGKNCLEMMVASSTTLKIIYEGTIQADSKAFDLLVKNKPAIIALYSDQQVKDKIEEACEKTLDNALQFKSVELHKEAKSKMKTYLPEKAEEFALTADLKFFQTNGNAKEFCRTCETLLKKESKSEACRN